jgi:hypothetical protein
MYKQAANPGGVVIQKLHFAIADTRAPVAATPLRLALEMVLYSHRNQILLVGHHRVARRLISPGP